MHFSMARNVKQLCRSTTHPAVRQSLKNSMQTGSIKKSQTAHATKKVSHHLGNKAKRNEVTKSTRKGSKLNQWNEKNMQKALEEYQLKKNEGVACLRAIARAWSVPKSTMERRLRVPHLGHAYASGRPTVFTKASETELATVILDLAHRGFPLSEVQVRNLATQFANANGLHVFSQKKTTRQATTGSKVSYDDIQNCVSNVQKDFLQPDLVQ